MRFHDTGGNLFLPNGLLNTNPLRFRPVGETQVLFAGPPGPGEQLRARPPAQTGQLQKIIATYKEVRPGIDEDYHALYPRMIREPERMDGMGRNA